MMRGGIGMKKRIRWFLAMIVTVGVVIGLSQVPVASGAVTLEVMNPRGEIPPVTVAGLSPRPATLDGKKIGFIDNNKTGADLFCTALEEQLKKKAPGVKVVRYQKPGAITFVPKLYEQVAQECDAFIFATGD
jgi:hypothetical protein